MNAAVEIVDGRVPLISGTAACSTLRVIELTKYAEEAGVDGALIVPPYYSKIDEKEIYGHYKAIDEAVTLVGADKKAEALALMKRITEKYGKTQAYKDHKDEIDALVLMASE